MTHEPRSVILNEDARRFLKKTGVLVVSVEVVVLAAIWLFQFWFGR